MLIEPRYTPARTARILVLVHLVESICCNLVVMEGKGENVGLEATHMLALLVVEAE